MDSNRNTNNKDRQRAPGEQGGQKKPFRGKRRSHHKKGHDRRPANADARRLNDALTNATQVNEQDAATAESRNQVNAPQQKKKQNRPSGTPSTGRPSRGTAMPKKPQELPQMNNLLIDDCPEEREDVSLDEISTDDVERILARDIFEKPQDGVIPSPIPEGKTVVAGIRFRTGGKTYFFDPGKLQCAMGQNAIVETARGLEFGEVCIPNRMIDDALIVAPLRPVVRIATKEDIEQNAQNHAKEEEATRIGKKKIAEHKLDMKLVSVQYTFDCSKLLFYFTSEGRVDFRELVKDLAGVFRIRIELRQIGIRDEARMVGGLGACGRPLCCSTFLSDFGQVSMKMAKDQGLSLNSTKNSGCCGRLMCCLRYEHETYLSLGRELPSPGTPVETPDGPGVVTEIYPLEAKVKVSLRGENAPAPKKYKKCDVSLPVRTSAEQAPLDEVSEPDTNV